MKNIVLYLLLLTLGTGLSQVQYPTMKIWPDLAPGTGDKADQEQWQDSSKVFKVYQPNLTLFLPEAGNGPVPAIVVCPGGGFRQLEMTKEGFKVARWLRNNGIAAFVLKYRLSPMEALQDAQQAMIVLRTQADELNIDPDRVGIMGFSAGAHVAGNLAMHYQTDGQSRALDSTLVKPDFWIGVYGGYRSNPDNGRDEYFRTFTSFAELVHPQSPPVLLVHAGNDSRVPAASSVELYSAYLSKGAPAELLVFERGAHGFALETDRGPEVTATVQTWSERCLQWLRIRWGMPGEN